MLKVRVENLLSPRSGKAVANQFIITTDEGEFFQSYKTVIAFKANDGKVTLDKAWDNSHTTNKYRNEFLGTDSKAVKARVESGEYTVADLN